MANRPFLLLAAALLVLLDTLPLSPLRSAACAAEVSELGGSSPQPSDPHPLTIGAPSQSKGDRRAKRNKNRRPRGFVLLGQRLLADDIAATPLADPAAGWTDAAMAGDLAQDKEMRWAFGRMESRPLMAAWHYEPIWTTPGQQRIVVQRLEQGSGSAVALYGNMLASFASQPLLPDGDGVFLAEELFPSATIGQESDERTSSASGTAAPADAPFAYRYRMDDRSSVKAGFSWIHDITDTTGMEQAFEQAGYGDSTDRVSAVNLTLGASYRAFTLTGGYIRAFDPNLGPAEPTTGIAPTPVAWNSELAYSTELMRRETTLAVGYQKSSESMQLYLPEERYRTKASMVLFDSTVFSLEYYLDKEYSTQNGITEDEGYGITTKIGFQF
jgi:hypothetical protein